MEFIDTPGYEKTATDWARPLQKIITECFEATYKAKRTKRYKNQGSCEKAEYDYNVCPNQRFTLCFSLYPKDAFRPSRPPT